MDWASVPAVSLLYLGAAAVLTVLAVLDVRTRRIPNRVWGPLYFVAFAALCLRGIVEPDLKIFVIRAGVSILIVGGLGLVSGLFGLFGGADAKAIMWLSVLAPTYPADLFNPVFVPDIGVFSLTIVTNAFIFGVLYQIALIGVNILRGEFDRRMLLGIRIPIIDLDEVHGRLLDVVASRDSAGYPESLGFGTGLDVDVLRMYLEWRGITLDEILSSPAFFRQTVPLEWRTAEVGDGRIEQPGDSSVDSSEGVCDGRATVRGVVSDGDLWGAEQFVESVGDVYGETPRSIRDGLDVIALKQSVWVSPGMPFFVALAAGFITAFLIGDIWFALFEILGL